MEGLGMKKLVYYMAIWNIFLPFGIFFGHLVIYLMAVWYIFPRLGILNKEKSGNTAARAD
jgi:hypothetical protein